MKSFSKPFVTWFLSLFNFGVYNLSDTIDSLIVRLRFLGLKEQAQDIARLTAQIELQQSTLIMLDGLKLVFMLISLVVLIVTNLDQISKAFNWGKQKWSSCYKYLSKLLSAIKTAIKNLF